MPWLKWDDKERKEVTILEDEDHVSYLHWVRGQAFDCHGGKCRYCDDGVRVSERHALECRSGGEQWTWEMAHLTWLDLEAVADEVGGLQGLVVAVVRHGTGTQTRYTIVPLGQDDRRLPELEEKAKSDVAADPQGAADFAKELAASLCITAKEALEQAALANARQWDDLSATQRLELLIGWLEAKVGEQAYQENVEPELDLDKLLG